MTAKDTVRALLDRLPDNCTLDDVQYHLYVIQAIARGVHGDRVVIRAFLHGARDFSKWRREEAPEL